MVLTLWWVRVLLQYTTYIISQTDWSLLLVSVSVSGSSEIKLWKTESMQDYLRRLGEITVVNTQDVILQSGSPTLFTEPWWWQEQITLGQGEWDAYSIHTHGVRMQVAWYSTQSAKRLVVMTSKWHHYLSELMLSLSSPRLRRSMRSLCRSWVRSLPHTRRAWSKCLTSASSMRSRDSPSLKRSCWTLNATSISLRTKGQWLVLSSIVPYIL